MKPVLLCANQRLLLCRLINSNGSVIRRGYSAAPDPELMKIHNVLPPNYKSFAGQMTFDQPAFNYDWIFTKQVDPTMKIPEWAYRKTFNPEAHEEYYGPLLLWKLLSATFWGWFFWRMYWGGYHVFLGEPEFSTGPDIALFTDAELGIPDDDTIPPRLY